jgi:hypothetical protein
MASKYVYTTADALKDLGGFLTDAEMTQLVKYYPTYGNAHRKGILPGILEGKSNEEILSSKLNAKGIDQKLLGKRSKGGHARWVVSKLRRAVIRILFLRYCLDEKQLRRVANRQLLKLFSSDEDSDSGRSGIRKSTQSSRVDSAISKF